MLVGDHATELGQQIRERVLGAHTWRLLSCARPAEVLGLPTQDMPDLVVLHGSAEADTDALFEHAKAVWPRTFFMLATRQTREALQPLMHRHGDLPLTDPDPALLGAAIGREVAGLSHGSLRGLSLPSLLQMMEWEAKSLAIRVQAGPLWGRLHLYKGRLVDAYVHQGPPTGDAAAYEILTWHNVSMTLERSYRNLQHVITQPLTTLLMEAMKRNDETQQADFSIDELLLDDQQGATEEDLMFRRSRPTPPKPTASPDPSQTSPTTLIDIHPTPPTQEINMANVKETLDSTLHTIDGAMAAALVDYSSGMALGTIGAGVNLELAAAGNTEVVRAKLRTMDSLGIKGGIEDILITLDKQYHIIYLIPGQSLFLYLVLNRDQANLAMARYKLKGLASDIKI